MSRDLGASVYYALYSSFLFILQLFVGLPLQCIDFACCRQIARGCTAFTRPTATELSLHACLPWLYTQSRALFITCFFDSTSVLQETWSTCYPPFFLNWSTCYPGAKVEHRICFSPLSTCFISFVVHLVAALMRKQRHEVTASILHHVLSHKWLAHLFLSCPSSSSTLMLHVLVTFFLVACSVTSSKTKGKCQVILLFTCSHASKFLKSHLKCSKKI